ncbi:MAG: gliding motility-associated ABC transporter substrate-binding protein GldG [Cytophagaceae bacterium]|nr:gliding motility-associated ABC transporter substrate-binding protein GldG [Cytophagaceae bacterium]MDW8457222.1 gliding motility-associated ABC transporter substrate-binding protein GldG [Cytophagaceae bacterium]
MRKKKQDITELLLIVGIFINVNIIGSVYFFRIDFTEDKRHSVSEAAREIMANVEEKLYVEVFLDGDLTPNYERLKRAIREKLNQLSVYARGHLQIKFTDPASEEDENIRKRLYAQLVQKGITPKYFLEEKNGKKTEKYIFPGAIISYKEREVSANFLKGNSILPEQRLVHQAVENVEFEFLNAIRKLTNKDFKSVAIIEGHGELSREELMEATNALNENYATERINLSTDTNLSRFSAIIVAGGTTKWTEQEKFLLDQYIINGGRLLILQDPTDVRKDSLQKGVTYSLIKDINLNDLLFKLGVRINPALVTDVSSSVTYVATGLSGEMQLLNFPYYPILYNYSSHPIVKNLDAMQARFAGTIDTVKAVGITKIPLVFTSKQSKIINAPSQISLESLKKDLQMEDYNQSYLPVVYLLEGKFTSLYKNRPSPIDGTKVTVQNKASKVIVCADVDLIRNEYNYRINKPVPLGYNTETRYLFSNKDFILNAIDYLCDQKIIYAKAKEIKLRPLDTAIINNRDERIWWQYVVNLILPISSILLLALALNILRKKKYTRF